MGGAVCADYARTVDGKQDGQVLQSDIVDELIVGALQEGGVDGNDGFDAFAGQSGGKGYGVLFGDADIEVAVGEALFEFHQPAAFAHGGGNGGQPVVGFGLIAQPLAEDLGVGGAGRGGSFRRPVALGGGFADGVVFDGVVFRQFVALPFFGDDVQQLGAGFAAQFVQRFDQLDDVVAVGGAGVGKAEIFKQRQGLFDVIAFVGQRFDFVFDLLRDFERAGQFVQYFFRLRLDGAEQAVHIAHHVAGEIFGQCADIGRNRHFVVVQNHEQIHVLHIARAV